MKTMRFTRLELRNWRNFKSVDVPLARRVFIVGPNAIGKSNFLDAFRFLRDLALDGGGLARAVEVRGGMSALRSLHAKQDNDVCVAVEVRDDAQEGWRYELSLNQRSQREARPQVRRECVSRLHADGSIEEVMARPGDAELKDREQLTQTALQQVAANQKFRELAEFFRSVSYLHIVPQLIREEQRPRQDDIGLDPYGRDLLDRIAETPPRFQRTRLRQIESMIKTVVPQMRELSLVRDRLGRPHLEVKFKHWRGSGARQNERQFSDGTLRLIGLLWALQDVGEPLLLEEPELSLHTQIVGRLAQFIHRAQESGAGRQVMLSTHSEHLLSDGGIGADEILLITPAAEGSKVLVAACHRTISRLLNAGLLPSEVLPAQTATKEMQLFDFSAA